MLEKGVDIDGQYGDQWHTALHEAAVYGNIQFIEFLISHGASINATSSSEATPLHLASQYGQEAAVDILVKHGANVELKMEKGATPLHVACGFGHIGTIKVLLEHQADISSRMTDQAMPIHIAAIRGQAAVVQLLLGHGTDSNATMSFHRTALHLAARYGNSHVVKLLLENGANVDQFMDKKLTPLHTAALWGHVGTVQVLLERGAKIDAAMENGLTAIHLASQCGHYAVAKLLLDNSASIDARHEHSWTPLHFACFRGHATVVQLLCENGAMLNTINSEGYIPGQIFNSDVDPTVQFKIRAILEKCMQDEAEGKWRERYRMEKMSNQKAQVWIDHLRGMTENAERRVVYAQTAKGVAEKELAKKTAELGVAVFSKQQEVDELRKNLGHQTRRAELLEQTLQKQFPEELTKKAVDGKNRTETSLNNLEIAFKRMSAKMNFLSIKHQEEIRQIEDEKAFSEADNKNQLIKPIGK